MNNKHGTFYFDTGKNFNEGEIHRFNFPDEADSNSFSIEVELPENTIAVRYDPVEGFGCLLQDLIITTDTDAPLEYQVLNGFKSENNEIAFNTIDPMILIYVRDKNLMKIKVKCNISFIYNMVQANENKGIKYYSCHALENFHLRFQKNDTKDLTICCEPIGKVPGVTTCETAEETLMNYIKLRASIITESIKISMIGEHNPNEEREFTSMCAKCSNYKLDNWFGSSDGKIQLVVLAVYPSPCNCKCIYCTVDRTPLEKNIYKEKFEKIIDILDIAQSNNMFADNVRFDIQSGEITIHPYKDKIFDFIKDKTVNFLTNCIIFNEKLAANLAANSGSIIFFSIDAGTPETWKKVKNVNNFDIIKENLLKYSVSCVNPWQIGLKYIILPGINDNEEDYKSLIEIMIQLKKNDLWISCDSRMKYNYKQRGSIIEAAGKLSSLLQNNNMTVYIDERCFLPDEMQKIYSQANIVKK